MTSRVNDAWQAMARLTSVADVASAHVLAARLDHEGIECHLRSEALGPYPIAVGAWGETEIWVADSDLEEARAILAALDAEAAGAAVDQAGVGKSPSMLRSLAWWLVAAALAAWLLYLRFVSLF